MKVVFTNEADVLMQLRMQGNGQTSVLSRKQKLLA